MSDEMNTDNRLFDMVQEVARKLDAIPNRHEFDALADQQRRGFENLETKFEKYVLSSEFNTYKDLIAQQFGTIVPRSEHEARWMTEEQRDRLVLGRLDRLEEFHNKDASSRIQIPGLTLILPVVLSAILSIAGIVYQHVYPTTIVIPANSTTTSSQSSTTTTQGHH